MNNILNNIDVSSSLSDVFELATTYQEEGMIIVVILNSVIAVRDHINYHIKRKDLIYNNCENILYSHRNKGEIFLIRRSDFFNKIIGFSIDKAIIHCNIEDFNKEFVNMCVKCYLRTRK